MTRFAALLGSISLMAVSHASAQEAAWLQIEAQPTLNEAQFRAQAYASSMPEVNGFALSSGWYAIALGPYSEERAQELRREYLRTGRIPRDSYVSDGAGYGQQFWPVGAINTRNQAPIEPESPQIDTTLPEVAADTPAPVQVTPAEPDLEPIFVEETPYEARANESLLTRQERDLLQIALQWSGHYNGRIDGAFGQGTRNSMASWQAANGYEVSGILTTRQRADLMGQYNAVFDGLGFELVSDMEAGIQMELPLGVVALKDHLTPFANYDATTDMPVQVLLISQPGDSATLGGLYEIMQTLEVVPTEGPRSLSRNSFTLEGANEQITSYTQASIENGAIKGFTLVWPAGDEARRSRVLDRMKASFTALDGYLSTALDLDATQDIDLVSGLAVRKPAFTRSALWADAQGRVVTLAEGLDSCTSLTIDSDYDATLVAADANGLLALIAPTQPLAPAARAILQQVPPRLQSEIAVGGYSFGGVLSAPSVTFGHIEDMASLTGDTRMMRLNIATTPADAGGPVVDMSGAVIGLMMGDHDGDRVLPDGVRFAVKESEIEAFLQSQGVAVETTADVGRMEAEDLRYVASDLTTLVECWQN